MEVRDHLLVGPDVTFRDTPNQGNAITPEYLIIHYTAKPTAASAIEQFCQPAARASAHVVIDRTGRICQLVAFRRKAWHAGDSRWAGRERLNDFSIGMELDNAGQLVKVGARYQAWFGGLYDEEAVLSARHKHERDVTHWHTYTEPQIAAALEVARLLVRTYALKDILGHDDVASARKVDPGPAFPMSSFRALVADRDPTDGPCPEADAQSSLVGRWLRWLVATRRSTRRGAPQGRVGSGT